MKRAELKVGEDYAIGRPASYSERVRATFRGEGSVKTIRNRYGTSEKKEVHGLLFELGEPWPRGMSSTAFTPNGITLDHDDEKRVVVESARFVVDTWAGFEARRERAQQNLRDEQRRREAREAEARELAGRFEALGLTPGSFSVYAHPDVSVRLTDYATRAVLALVPDGAKIEAS